MHAYDKNKSFRRIIKTPNLYSHLIVIDMYKNMRDNTGQVFSIRNQTEYRKYLSIYISTNSMFQYYFNDL